MELYNTLSIAELRKVLSENGVKESGSSKEELLKQINQVLLTNALIQDMMEEEVIPLPTPDPRTQERLQQDQAYEQSLLQDQGAFRDKELSIQDQDAFRNKELSIEELREQRVAYYTQ